MGSARRPREKRYTPEQLEQMASAMEERRKAALGNLTGPKRNKPGPKPGMFRFKSRGEAQLVIRQVVNYMREYDMALRDGRDPKLATPENPMPGIMPDIGQKILNGIATYVQTERATVEERLKIEQMTRDAVMKERELTLKERQAKDNGELERLRAIVARFESQLTRAEGGNGVYDQ